MMSCIFKTNGSHDDNRSMRQIENRTLDVIGQNMMKFYHALSVYLISYVSFYDLFQRLVALRKIYFLFQFPKLTENIAKSISLKWDVVLAQRVELLLRISDIRSSNPILAKFYLLSTVWNLLRKRRK